MTGSIVSNVPEKPKRESGLELYRIILMLAIIAHHYFVNSGLMEKVSSTTTSLWRTQIRFSRWRHQSHCFCSSRICVLNTAGSSMQQRDLFSIHANSDAMRQWLWRDILHNPAMLESGWLVFHAIGSVLGIFAVCTVIDQCRIHFLETPFFKFWNAERKKHVIAWDRQMIRLKEQ